MRVKKFTEGPWFSFTEKNKILTVSSSATRGEMELLEDEQDIDTSICGIWLHGVDIEEKEQHVANAHLIAAAPQMLEALEDILDRFKWSMLAADIDGGDSKRILLAAHDAINKAYGE